MVRVSVCVCPRTLPAKMIVAPNSPDAAGEGEHPAGQQPAGGQRQPDAPERPPGPGAQRARGVGEVRVDRLEGADRLADVERRGHEGDRQDDRRLGEGELMPASRSAAPKQPAGPRPRRAGRCPPPPAAAPAAARPASPPARGPRKRRRAMKHAVGVPKPRISALAMRFVRRVTASASCTAGSRSRLGHVTERHLGEQRDDRDRQEGERDPGDERQQRGERALARISRAAAARSRRPSARRGRPCP